MLSPMLPHAAGGLNVAPLTPPAGGGGGGGGGGRRGCLAGVLCRDRLRDERAVPEGVTEAYGVSRADRVARLEVGSGSDLRRRGYGERCGEERARDPLQPHSLSPLVPLMSRRRE